MQQNTDLTQLIKGLSERDFETLTGEVHSPLIKVVK